MKRLLFALLLLCVMITTACSAQVRRDANPIHTSIDVICKEKKIWIEQSLTNVGTSTLTIATTQLPWGRDGGLVLEIQNQGDMHNVEMMGGWKSAAGKIEHLDPKESISYEVPIDQIFDIRQVDLTTRNILSWRYPSPVLKNKSALGGVLLKERWCQQ